MNEGTHMGVRVQSAFGCNGPIHKGVAVHCCIALFNNNLYGFIVGEMLMNLQQDVKRVPYTTL